MLFSNIIMLFSACLLNMSRVCRSEYKFIWKCFLDEQEVGGSTHKLEPKHLTEPDRNSFHRLRLIYEGIAATGAGMS